MSGNSETCLNMVEEKSGLQASLGNLPKKGTRHILSGTLRGWSGELLASSVPGISAPNDLRCIWDTYVLTGVAVEVSASEVLKAGLTYKLSTMKDFQPHLPSQEFPNPQNINNNNSKEAKYKTTSKHNAMIRPRIACVQVLDLTDDGPRKYVADIGEQRLVEIPSWPCSE